MRAKIFLNKARTSLRLWAGVVTQFRPPTGDLACCNVAVLAEDHHAASVCVAQHWPDWDLQSLTCLSDFPWFKQIILDSDCPQVESLKHFVIEGIEVVHVEGI
jgi:hypothetical protein